MSPAAVEPGRPHALVDVTPRDRDGKAPDVAAHDRAIGWVLVLLLAGVLVGCLIAFVRRTTNRVAKQRAERAIEEAFEALDREASRSRGP